MLLTTTDTPDVMDHFPDAEYQLLLIEDNPGDIVLIEEYLASISNEMDCEIAKSYQEAENLLKKSTVLPDLILLDLKLSDAEGEELIKNILALSENTVPVVILTGYADMQFSIKSLNLGVSDYLVKDELNPNTLWKSIRFSIERKQASKKLRESEQRYRYLFENNPSSILIWDLQNRRILASNHEAELKYGFTKSQFVNLKIDDIYKNESASVLPSDSNDFREGKALNLETGHYNHKKRNGTVFFAEVKGHYIFYEGKKSVLLQIQDATEKVKMQEKLLESSRRAEEAERNRISSELHDGIVQQLVACGMFTQNIADKLKRGQTVTEEVERLYDLLLKTTMQTRDISHNLKSAEFDESSLSELLEQLVRQLVQAGSIEFVLNNHLRTETEFKRKFKVNVYRAIQELCNNIVKHSQASRAVITAEEINGCLYITIKDDGTGFNYIDPESLGFGLRNVESRMLRFGGEIEFSNTREGGLQVDLEIPSDFM
ncbi:response regulator [Rhodohalobacter sp. SW132]|uniref:response regulator n=1 Tax=Rhodohalobacter sp. SW132 TaxID=2293433 RepID=UPI000E256477|nr:response regulator [Rhodohalobacter sp. SW132]REL29139.1 response regulator [Rhodohalobacter sp. SW132]